MKTKRARRMALVFALIGALLIAGSAVALTRSGILERLFYGQTPPEEAVALVETMDDRVESAGVTIKLDEYLYDGETLALSYTLSTDSTEPLLIYEPRVFYQPRDKDVHVMYFTEEWYQTWSFRALGGTFGREMVGGGQGDVLKQSQGSDLNLTIEVDVYRPLGALVASDELAGEKDLVMTGNALTGEESERNSAIFNAYYENCERLGIEMTGEAGALLEAGVVEKVGTVAITRALSPKMTEEAKARTVTLDAPIQLSVEGATLTLESLKFTTASSQYGMTLRPNDGVSHDDPSLERWLWSGMFDEKGELLQFNMGGGNFLAADGAQVHVMDYSAAPFAQMPKAIVICPQKEGYTHKEGDRLMDRYDLNEGIRLEIRDGKVIPPAPVGQREVIYADDFTADEVGIGKGAPYEKSNGRLRTCRQRC